MTIIISYIINLTSKCEHEIFLAMVEETEKEEMRFRRMEGNFHPMSCSTTSFVHISLDVSLMILP